MVEYLVKSCLLKPVTLLPRGAALPQQEQCKAPLHQLLDKPWVVTAVPVAALLGQYDGMRLWDIGLTDYCALLCVARRCYYMISRRPLCFFLELEQISNFSYSTSSCFEKGEKKTEATALLGAGTLESLEVEGEHLWQSQD